MPIARIGQDFIVKSLRTDGQHMPSISALAGGRFVAAWQSEDTADGNSGCIRARLYNADGLPAGADFIVNTTPTFDQIYPAITMLSNGRFVAGMRSCPTFQHGRHCRRHRLRPQLYVDA